MFHLEHVSSWCTCSLPPLPTPFFLALGFHLLACHWFRAGRLPRTSGSFIVSGPLCTFSGPASWSWSRWSCRAKVLSLLRSFKHTHLYTASGHLLSVSELCQDLTEQILPAGQARGTHSCPSSVASHILRNICKVTHGGEKGYHFPLCLTFFGVPQNVWTLICVLPRATKWETWE